MTDQIGELLPSHMGDMLGAPFDVELVMSVRRTADGDTHIPALPALIAAVGMARLWRDERLSGDELKFLRKAAGMNRQRLGEAIGGGAGDIETYEKGPRPMALALEKYIRLHLFNVLRLIDGPRIDDMINYLEWTFEEWKPTFREVGRPLKVILRHHQSGWQEMGIR